MPQDITAPVHENRDLGHGNFLLDFEAPGTAGEVVPGQFFMIGVPHSDLLLRRPFSVCGMPGTFEGSSPDRVQVLYRVVGAGTELLASLRPGTLLSVLGPLGRGFSLPDAKEAPALLVAGGIGSAPFPALIAALARAGAPRPILLYGARSAGDLPLLAWFQDRCQQVVVTTDDGSAGRKALVTAALAEALASPGRAARVYACGPEPMLRAVARMCLEARAPTELSVEAHMACGFGVCLGCVVPTRSVRAGQIGYERVCVDGPVMRAERLAW